MTKRRFNGRGHGPQSKRRRTDVPQLSRSQRKTWKELGEIHPADERDTVRNYAKVEEEKAEAFESSSNSEESEEETVVEKIMKNLGVSMDPDEETSDEDDEEEEDEEGDSSEEDDADSEADVSEKKRKLDTKTVLRDTQRKTVKNDVGDESDEELTAEKPADENEEGEEEEEEKEEEEEEVLDDGEEETAEHQLKEDDLFSIHFEKDLPDKLVEKLSATKTWKDKDIKVKSVGAARFLWKKSSLVTKDVKVEKDLKKMGVKHKLADQVAVTNKRECQVDPKEHEGGLTPFQCGLFNILNKYQDLLYPRQTVNNMEETRLTYCLHAVNHVLKTRSRVIAHNTKLRARAESKDTSEVEYRDQGLTRPKVLIVLPTRHSAYRVISLIISLLSSSDQEMVSKRKRFITEYGPQGQDDDKKGLKPADFDALFEGNTDEHFRIGLSVSKKSIRLYSPFYMADIIVASPLGLRTVIGAPGDKDRDYDFLSSIEILILDQTDFFIMQNWDHILHLFEHMHLQPRQSHNVDFTRSRMWALNGWSRYYRQTVILCSHLMPEIVSIFNSSCHNYCGKVEVQTKALPGSVCQICIQLPQMFYKVECSVHTELAEARFQFFLKEILPQYKEKDRKQTLIFIPSYFDFVRVRNHFKREAIGFTHINEYATSKGIRRARLEFKKKRAHFMLLTERVHFYRRFKLRGPKHIIFYALPQYPHFYSEICNMLVEPGRISINMPTCSILYSRYELLKLAAVVGLSRAEQMITSKKTVHMLVSGDAS